MWTALEPNGEHAHLRTSLARFFLSQIVIVVALTLFRNHSSINTSAAAAAAPAHRRASRPLYPCVGRLRFQSILDRSLVDLGLTTQDLELFFSKTSLHGLQCVDKEVEIAARWR